MSLATPEDYPAVEQMSQAANREEVATPLSAATIRWLVDENPVGRGFVVLARTVPVGEIIGHFVFYPRRLVVRTSAGLERLPTYLYVALYVAPSHRRVGAFSAMTRYGIDLLARLGVRFAYTVPNPRSGAGFLKMGMSEIGRVPFWASPLGVLGRPLGALGALGALGSGVQVADRRLDERHARLVAITAPAFAHVWGDRTLDEMRWRYERRPGVDYQVVNAEQGADLVGFAIARQMRIGSRLATIVCDLWSAPGRASAGAALIAALRRESVDMLAVPGGHRGPLGRRALLAAGLVPVPQRLLPQPVSVIGGPVGDRSERWMAPGGLGGWLISPYDWDVF